MMKTSQNPLRDVKKKKKALRVKFTSARSLLAAVMGLFTAMPSALLMRDSGRPPFQIIADVMDTLWSRRCRGLGGLRRAAREGRSCIIDVGSCLKSAYCNGTCDSCGPEAQRQFLIWQRWERKKAACFVGAAMKRSRAGELIKTDT